MAYNSSFQVSCAILLFDATVSFILGASDDAHDCLALTTQSPPAVEHRDEAKADD